jgi:hypothetical protein
VVREAKPVFQTEHAYPTGPAVSLSFYRITEYERAVQNLVFLRIEWVDLIALDQLDFLEGDRPLICRLIADGGAAVFLE